PHVSFLLRIYEFRFLTVVLSWFSASLSFSSSGGCRYLHSFPTRRSSDLRSPAVRGRTNGCRSWERGPPGRSPHGRRARAWPAGRDRKSTRLNSSHVSISYAVFCLKKKKTKRSTHHN